MEENEILLSLDVVSLFTMIPIKESINVIEELTDPETSKLVGLCLNSTFYSFMGELYGFPPLSHYSQPLHGKI